MVRTLIGRHFYHNVKRPEKTFIEPFLSPLPITNNDTIFLLPPGKRAKFGMLIWMATTLCGWFFRFRESIPVQKAVGRTRKHRKIAYGVVMVVIILFFSVSSSPSYHAIVAREIANDVDGRVIEEVFPFSAEARLGLSPALFGGAFVAEAHGIGTTEDLGSGGQGEEPVGILIHSSSLVSSLSPLTIESSTNNRSDVTAYIVQPGDTPSTIAARFGITTNTLLWSNGLSSLGIIRPGDELQILPVTGLLHTVKSGDTVSSIANQFQADAREIISFNGLPADGSIRIGDTLIIPDGVKPQPRYSAPSQQYAVGLPSVSGYFIFPAPGRISQGLHGYNAVDVAHGGCYAYNVPVYSAASGRVTVADGSGWNGGYGQFLTVQHANGTATLYAHLRAILVGAGAQVNQGQIIGYMGSTGRSTGCHVHFEVHGARNPFVF